METITIIGIIGGLLVILSGIITKFANHSNKIAELEKDVNEIKTDMNTLETKIDNLNDKVTALDSDLQIIKATTKQTNDFVCNLLAEHNTDLANISTYIAQHKLCSNYKVDAKE